MTTLTAESITVGYGADPVLEAFDFVVQPQAFTAILGPNGCGKSTLVNTLARTLNPTSGFVALDGTPLTELKSVDIARRVGLLPQHPVVPESITVRALVARGRHPYHSMWRQWAAGDDEAIGHALAVTDIESLADRPVASLSGGQRQRAWIAMVLAQDTDIILLDEPTSFLDLAHQLEVMKLCQSLRDLGRAVVAVLHDINQAARYCDRIALMRDGTLVADGASRDVMTTDVINEVFGVAVKIVDDIDSCGPVIVPVDSAS